MLLLAKYSGFEICNAQVNQCSSLRTFSLFTEAESRGQSQEKGLLQSWIGGYFTTLACSMTTKVP
jgi:hypothetical protein